ncbi:hypothetical protein PQH03_12615 [Ralstonia insidiosa]|jgi:hypothetical protein|uniref:hypothetical protein n=1 Tax=Ralstonia TaxID=48736 RepID=UPI000664ACE9|nr:hypothetical protein [Ralstonia insidiosa]KMW45439.1 membrane protein [Ralstonia sp. MD27]MBX3774656.1 hypothetical protein [Ralstonia pickettii]NPA02736.1 hypothetical protein [Betaproteobacteria bacterium]MBA9859567.1 hypothetical protein [Ralstonia insidiosa]MBA9871087.1 hypothetical protein [Ralstonia insidiosa]
MKRKVHATAAVLCLLFLSAFWTSTVVAELFLSAAAVAQVKQGIAYALLVFVPAMMVTGATGFAMGAKGQHPLLVGKRRRMPFIAANGLLILVPAAIFLSVRAQAGMFDGAFYAVQAVELLAGAINVTLIGLNIRDGLRLSRRRRVA